MRACFNLALAMNGIVGAALIGCHSPSAPNVPPDARSVDAATNGNCTDGVTFTLVNTTGYTPAGPLSVFRYAETYYQTAFCPDEYVVVLTQTMTQVNCTSDRSLMLEVSFPYNTAQAGSENISAKATEFAFPNTLDSTTQVMFDATEIDSPSTPSPRITGTFVSNAPGWSMNLPIDLHSQGVTVCD